jgi:hypothetical protein
MLRNDFYKKMVEEGIYCTEEDLEERRVMAKSVLKGVVAVLLLVLFAILATGCSSTTPAPRVIKEVEVVERKVPVAVAIPEIDCKFQGEGLEPTVNLMACLILHKRIIDILRRADGKSIEEIQSELDAALKEKVDAGSKIK